MVVGHGQPMVALGRPWNLAIGSLLMYHLMRMASHTSAPLSPYTAKTKTTRAKLAFAGIAATSCLQII